MEPRLLSKPVTKITSPYENQNSIFIIEETSIKPLKYIIINNMSFEVKRF